MSLLQILEPGSAAEAPAALIALGAFGGTGVTVIDRFDATSHAPAPLIPSLSPVRSGGEGGESD